MCYAWMSVGLVLAKAREGIESCGMGDLKGYELTCECWDLNPGLVKEQPVHLTTEPFLWLFLPTSPDKQVFGVPGRPHTHSTSLV